jgi:ADP-ribose pyrophosphatase YjhB (NUDIX family)
MHVLSLVGEPSGSVDWRIRLFFGSASLQISRTSTEPPYMPISEYIRKLRERIGHGLVQMPCASAVIRDQGRILLLRRSDNGKWALPGGAIDPGEHPAQALVREVREETGLHVRPTRVLGVVGAARHTYPNGDQVEVIVTVFACDVVGGALECCDGEAVELRYFDPGALPELMTQYPQEILTGSGEAAHFVWQEAWVGHGNSASD